MNATNTTHSYTGDDVIQPSNQVQDETPHIVYYEEPTLTIPPFPTDPNALHPGSVVIRTEEALIVIMVLVLWVAAIALFFNRWGKIRMLEPYQPKFHQEHRPSCPAADTIGGQHRASVSKFGMMDPPIFASVGGAYRTLAASRPRQNSVFVGGSFNQLPSNPPRKTKSAMDIQSLVLNEQSSATGSIISNSGAGLGMKQSLSPQDRRTSVSGFLRRPSCSTGLLLSPSITGRRNSAISDFLPLKDRLQAPHYHTDFLSPLPSCSHLSPGYSGRSGPDGQSGPDGRSGPSSRRMSMCASDHYSSRERRPSFNNVLAQVTAERRPSSSMLRISNV